jgi:hypothetical protein
VSAARIRADLDAALAAALPSSGGRVRVAIQKLCSELVLADEQREAAAERLAAFHDQLRGGGGGVGSE